MSNDQPFAYLVDDDEAVRDSLGMLFNSLGLPHRVFPSALDCLEHHEPNRHSCLVADIRMQG